MTMKWNFLHKPAHLHIRTQKWNISRRDDNKLAQHSPTTNTVSTTPPCKSKTDMRYIYKRKRKKWALQRWRRSLNSSIHRLVHFCTKIFDKFVERKSTSVAPLCAEQLAVALFCLWLDILPRVSWVIYPLCS